MRAYFIPLDVFDVASAVNKLDYFHREFFSPNFYVWLEFSFLISLWVLCN